MMVQLLIEESNNLNNNKIIQLGWIRIPPICSYLKVDRLVDRLYNCPL